MKGKASGKRRGRTAFAGAESTGSNSARNGAGEERRRRKCFLPGEEIIAFFSGRALLRSAWLWAAALSGLAFLVRLIYLLEIRSLPFFSSPVIDAGTYLDQALAISRGRWFDREAFWQAPLYSYFLAFLIRLTGVRPDLLHVCHSFLAGLNCGLITLVGFRLFRPGVAILAGFLAAFYGPMIFFDGEFLPPSLIIFLNLLLLLALRRALERKTFSSFAAAGALLGLSLAALPTMLLFAPLAVLLLTLTLRYQLSGRGLAVRLALFVLTAGLVLSPVTLHNALVSREFVLISSNGGANFFLGNNRNWRQTVAIRPTFEWGDLMALPFRAGALSPASRSAYFYRLAFSEIRASPAEALVRFVVKTGQFFYGHEYPRNVDLYAYRPFSRLLRVLLWERGIAFPFGLIAPLALLGAALTLFHRTPERNLLLLYLLAITASGILFFVTSRYRLSGVPVLLLFSAEALFWLAAQARRRRYRSLAFALVGVFAALVLCNYGVAGAPRLSQWEWHLMLGHSWRREGKLDRALAEYRRSAALAPERPDGWFHAGGVLAALHHSAEAERMFREALRRAPGEESMAAAWAWEALGDLARQIGEKKKAEEYYRRALSAFAFQFGARLSLAQVLAERGELEGAEVELRDLAVRYPRDSLPWSGLAELAEKRGKQEEAAQLWEKAARLTPDNPEFWFSLAVVHLQQGKPELARKEVERAFRLNPADPRFLQLRLSLEAGPGR